MLKLLSCVRGGSVDSSDGLSLSSCLYLCLMFDSPPALPCSPSHSVPHLPAPPAGFSFWVTTGAFEAVPWFNQLLKLVPLPSDEFRRQVGPLARPRVRADAPP